MQGLQTKPVNQQLTWKSPLQISTVLHMLIWSSNNMTENNSWLLQETTKNSEREKWEKNVYWLIITKPLSSSTKNTLDKKTLIFLPSSSWLKSDNSL